MLSFKTQFQLNFLSKWRTNPPKENYSVGSIYVFGSIIEHYISPLFAKNWNINSYVYWQLIVFSSKLQNLKQVLHFSVFFVD